MFCGEVILENRNIINDVLNIKFKDMRPWPYRTALDLLSDYQLKSELIKIMAYICSTLFRYHVMMVGMSF